MMLTGTFLFPMEDAKQVYKRIKESNITYDSFTNYPHLSHDSKDFMAKCLAKKSSDRWDAKDLLKHPWLTNDKRAEIDETTKKEILMNLKKCHAKS